MHSLLTGKFEDPAFPTPNPNPIVEDPWDADAHLAAMRRLLDLAGRNRGPAGDRFLKAAEVHAKAAETAPTKVDDPHADALRTAPPARTTPRDGDTL